MTIKTNHFKIFLHALRTGIIFIAGFLAYELLKNLENYVPIECFDRSPLTPCSTSPQANVPRTFCPGDSDGR